MRKADDSSVTRPWRRHAVPARAAQRQTAAPLLSTMLGVLLFASGCGGVPPDEAARTPTPVRAAAALAGPAAATIRSHGLIANRNEIRLAFKVGGIIGELDVEEGASVQQGQRLAALEQTETDAQLEQVQQENDKAQRDLQRGERLHADQVISLEQLQDLRTRAGMAAAVLKAARFNRSHAEIIAPHNGTILRRLAKAREMISPGEPVLVLGTHDGGYIVNAGLADREIVQVKHGDTAQVRLDALPEALLTGTLTQIASAAEPSGGLFRIEVSLKDSQLPLRSGMVASLAIVPASAQAAEKIHVPIDAIIEGHGSAAHVFVLQRGAHGAQAHRREVRIAFIDGEDVALAAGLFAGEQVITDGAAYLEDGEIVEVVDPESPGIIR